MISKNETVLNDFAAYCAENPDLRFWQALRNWSGFPFVWVSNGLSEDPGVKDTFYWDGKDR